MTGPDGVHQDESAPWTWAPFLYLRPIARFRSVAIGALSPKRPLPVETRSLCRPGRVHPRREESRAAEPRPGRPGRRQKRDHDGPNRAQRRYYWNLERTITV